MIKTTNKPTTINRIDVNCGKKPSCVDIQYLLKAGRLVEYVMIKKQREKDRKEKRYIICCDCGTKTLRCMFDGNSKYCNQCLSKKQKQSTIDQKEYHKEYIRGNGKVGRHTKQIVYHCKKIGLIKQSPCEVCGELKSQAHHDDYNYPLVVRRLCRMHHQEWHNNNKPIRFIGG